MKENLGKLILVRVSKSSSFAGVDGRLYLKLSGKRFLLFTLF